MSKLYDWNVGAVEELTRLWTSGMSATEIAVAMNIVSRDAVLGKVHRLKLPKRRMFKPLKAKPAPRPKRSTANVNILRRPAAPVAPRRLFAAAAPPIENAWEPLVGSHPVSLLDLRDDQCRWPVGEPVRFCGCQAIEKRSYCEHHYQMSVGSGTASERAAVRRGISIGMRETA